MTYGFFVFAFSAVVQALQEALGETGILQFVVCSYQRQFNDDIDKRRLKQTNWDREAQLLANRLGVTIAFCSNECGIDSKKPGVISGRAEPTAEPTTCTWIIKRPRKATEGIPWF